MELSVSIVNASGIVKAPASKSFAHRHLICAALADKKSYLHAEEISKDMQATTDCLNALGAKIEHDGKGYSITPITKINTKALLDCNESGSTFRFMLPVACALGAQAIFTMEQGLAKRPITHLHDALQLHGCSLSKEGSIPFHTKGTLVSGTYSLPGDISSQYISGLLMALPLLDKDSQIVLTTQLESADYVDMSIQVLKQYGVVIDKKEHKEIKEEIKKETKKEEKKERKEKEEERIVFHIPGNARYAVQGESHVEGDWSNAAFFLCLGALSKQGIVVEGLNIDSLQGDKRVLDILVQMGAHVEIEKDLLNEGLSRITVKRDVLNAVDIDASDIPDIIPVLSVVAAVAFGTTRIYNAGRLSIKESDRLSTTHETLKALGADISITQDTITIKGKEHLEGGVIHSHNDHRIAMSAAVASSICASPVIIQDALAVEKSYPLFFKHFESVNGTVKKV